jgi:hypothetical protein
VSRRSVKKAGFYLQCRVPDSLEAGGGGGAGRPGPHPLGSGAFYCMEEDRQLCLPCSAWRMVRLQCVKRLTCHLPASPHIYLS